jgi:hypothetical protein
MGANAQTSVPAFTSGQVLTAAQMTQVNTGIPVFASSTERDAAFGGAGEKTLAEGQMAYLEDTNATQYYDGSSWAAVAGGKILQVVSTAKTDTFTASLGGHGSTAVTGLSVAITPTSATSTILVLATVNGARGSNGPLAISLKRGAIGIFLGDAAGSRMQVTSYSYSNNDSEMTNIGLSYVDSPATTSATTYSIDIHNTTGTTESVYVNRSAGDSNTASYARTSSSITVLEVSA